MGRFGARRQVTYLSHRAVELLCSGALRSWKSKVCAPLDTGSFFRFLLELSCSRFLPRWSRTQPKLSQSQPFRGQNPRRAS